MARGGIDNNWSNKRSKENPSPLKLEFDDYLATTVDMLEWWAANQVRFPGVAVVALKYLAVPVTSILS